MPRLKEIDRLVSQLFAERWINLHAPKCLDRSYLKFPGVYILAYSVADLEGLRVKSADVFYVGMSNAAGGVGQRLKQFKAGIENNGLHSGAMRFYREHGRNVPFSSGRGRKKLYFAAVTLQCDSNKVTAKAADLIQMGHVCCVEYYAIAQITRRTGRKPPLNKFGPREG